MHARGQGATAVAGPTRARGARTAAVAAPLRARGTLRRLLLPEVQTQLTESRASEARAAATAGMMSGFTMEEKAARVATLLENIGLVRDFAPISVVSNPPVLLVVLDTEEEFDWTAPFDRAHQSVTALGGMAEGQRYFEAAHVRDVLAILRWVENPADEVAAFRTLQLLPGVGPATARRTLGALAGQPGRLGGVSGARGGCRRAGLARFSLVGRRGGRRRGSPRSAR